MGGNATDHGEYYKTKRIFRQDYLINFQKGLLKSPKLQYFMIVDSGLLAFKERPGKIEDETKLLGFLPYEKILSIKLDYIELDSCKLSCMQMMSKTGIIFTLAFKCKEDRDDWMMVIMRYVSEMLLQTKAFQKSYEQVSISEERSCNDLKRCKSNDEMNLSHKRWKEEKGSIQLSKSLDILALPVVTDTALFIHNAQINSGTPADSKQNNLSPGSRKRKSEPEIYEDLTMYLSNGRHARKDDTAKTPNILLNSCCFEHRDSIELEAEKKLKNAIKHNKRNNVFAKFLTYLENALNTDLECTPLIQ